MNDKRKVWVISINESETSEISETSETSETSENRRRQRKEEKWNNRVTGNTRLRVKRDKSREKANKINRPIELINSNHSR